MVTLEDYVALTSIFTLALSCSIIQVDQVINLWQLTPTQVLPWSIRAGGIGPAAPVLVGPVFSQGKSKIPFLQKESNKQSAC